mgnify:CR=1 FL=1
MRDMERDAERNLVLRLRDGDSEAFDLLYDTYNARLLTFLTRLTASRSVAEDLVAETWLRLVGHAGELRDDTRFGPWLYTVARNPYVSHVRARSLEGTHLSELAPSWSTLGGRSPFEEAATSELERRIEAVLLRLPLD